MREGVSIRVIIQTKESKGPRARKWVCKDEGIRRGVIAHTREHMKDDDTWENARGSEQARGSARNNCDRDRAEGCKRETEGRDKCKEDRGR